MAIYPITFVTRQDLIKKRKKVKEIFLKCEELKKFANLYFKQSLKGAKTIKDKVD
jgi:hypothetical protein